MADVFLALARGPHGADKWAVLKRPRDRSDPSMTRMFRDEARLSMRFNHPNVVHAYEAVETDGECFLALEYLEGQPLNVLLAALEKRRRRLSSELATFIAAQALKGLHYAHELVDWDGARLELVHRDVSPQNIFVTYEGRIKVVDFGLAKSRLIATQTERGVLKGKVRYMSPEQAVGGSLDRRSDVFSLGVVLWEMLAGRALLEGPPKSMITRLTDEDLPSLRSLRVPVRDDLDAAVEKALRRCPDERFATAEAMEGALESCICGRPDASWERDLGALMDTLFADERVDERAQLLGGASATAGEVDSPPFFARDARRLCDRSRVGATTRHEGGRERRRSRRQWKRMAVVATLSAFTGLAALPWIGCYAEGAPGYTAFGALARGVSGVFCARAHSTSVHSVPRMTSK